MKKEGIYFIDPTSENQQDLDILRNKIMQNTVSLVSLIRERSYIARQIAVLKNSMNLPIRDRKREINVMSQSGALSTDELGLLNMIFEFTINVQEHSFRARENVVKWIGSDLEVKGNTSVLSYLAGLLITTPGSEIHCSGDPGPAMKLGISANGGHIIDGMLDSPDLRVCIGFDEKECSISINPDGRMKIAPTVLQRRHASMGVVVEAR